MDLYLQHKTAVVTGASQGLGRSIVKTLAAEGVKVLATARNEALLLSLQSEIKAEGGVVPEILVQDFTAPGGPAAIAAAALQALGHVDILINNAGASRPLGPIAPEEEWEAAFTLDFHHHRQLTQALLPQFMERKQGAILNLISTYELRSINGSAVAKAAIASWSKALAGELASQGIRVNCLQPGIIDSAQIRRIFPGDERKKFAEREIPMGDFGEPEDIANMATFLVSPRAKYVTGTVAVVDGGMRRYAF
ncbi:3-oxoacyl-[acyl-carrier protein] reductase [Chitinophaga jiangningensis]|uniref:3-oxoacyl-[acyl-carrier protein] reductase n=1 Tax=Chitinophaga jiangningensis TaxID=1419482 RepID=A0A1M6WWR2_9BACT|nr:SDR family oxidoreductase [Chitinophaga jiangningensis]SHK97999.1 3-oxoacyl-[acyl-carrier protein] reductase [Chitinophaga jiangningensis]